MPGAARQTALLRNTGARDVWVSSHYPLDQVNPAVVVRLAGEAQPGTVPGAALEPGAAVPRGLRLDLPAGEALLLRAGQERAMTVVAGLGREAADERA